MAERSLRISLPSGAAVRSSDVDVPPGVVISGVLRSAHHAEDGSRQVLCLTLPGEVVAAGNERNGTEMEAATEVQLCRIHPESFRRTLRDRAQLRRALVAQAQAKLDRLRGLALALLGLTIEERLAEFLVEAAGFMPWQPLPDGGGILTITLERGDIADLLATSAESISRITHRFEDSGHLRIRDPRHFEIPDLGRLSRLAHAEGGRREEGPSGAESVRHMTAAHGRARCASGQASV